LFKIRDYGIEMLPKNIAESVDVIGGINSHTFVVNLN